MALLVTGRGNILLFAIVLANQKQFRFKNVTLHFPDAQVSMNNTFEVNILIHAINHKSETTFFTGIQCLMIEFDKGLEINRQFLEDEETD